MNTNWPLTLCTGIYCAFGLSLLIATPWLAEEMGQPIDGTLIGIVVFLSAIHMYLAYAAYKAKNGTAAQKKHFGIISGFVFCFIAGQAGWALATVLGIPVLLGFYGIRDVFRKNSAV